MKVLGIESSCDETGIAVYDTDSGEIRQRLYSQIEKHREYGGVVPELASRDHVVKAAPLLIELLDEIGGVEALDGIAAALEVRVVAGKKVQAIVGLRDQGADVFVDGVPVDIRFG